jgi:hypothetical protein
MAKKSAFTRDPKQVEAPTFKYGENKTAYESLDPQKQRRYQELLNTKGRSAANTYLGQTSGQPVRQPGKAPVPSQQTVGAIPFAEQTPEQQINQMADIGGDIYSRMAGFAQNFNPQTFQQQYEPQFQQAMDRARQGVINQFEQRNAQSFAKERQDFETAMANRGVSPGSQQYQAELQGLTDRQDRARQEALNAAEQAAYGIQAQGYQQATGTAMLPGEIQAQYQAPFIAQYGQAANQSQLAQQQQYAKELAALENKYRLQQIRATPRGGGGGGGGGGGLDPYQQYELAQTMSRYNEGTPQPNPLATGISSLVSNIGPAVINRMGK